MRHLKGVAHTGNLRRTHEHGFMHASMGEGHFYSPFPALTSGVNYKACKLSDNKMVANKLA